MVLVTMLSVAFCFGFPTLQKNKNQFVSTLSSGAHVLHSNQLHLLVRLNLLPCTWNAAVIPIYLMQMFLSVGKQMQSHVSRVVE